MKKTLVTAIVVLASLPAVRAANILVEADFDSTVPLSTTADGFSGSSITNSGVATVGVGGSNGGFVEADNSGGGPSSFFRVNALFGSAGTAAVTEFDLSKVRFDVDLAQAGGVGPTVRLWAVLFGFDSSLGSLFIMQSPDIVVGTGFSSHSSTLDNWSFSSGSWDPALIDQINVSIQVAFPNPGGEFGVDTGNSIFVDNIALLEIPEPGPAVLGLLALVPALLRRKV